jgi:hypothetical protein
MSITITGLPTVGSVTDTTYIPSETSSVTGKITALSLRNYVASGTLSTVTATTLVSTTSAIGTAAAISLTTSGDVVIGGNLTILGGEYVAGNVSGNYFLGNVQGNVAGNLVGNVSGTLIGNVVNPTSGGGAIVGNLTAYVTFPTQPYITNLGNITANVLTVNANVRSGNLSTLGTANVGTLIVTGTSTYTGDLLANANVTVNIGSTTNWFNQIYGTAVHALYADLAERYTSDSQYPPGTVVVFGTTTEVTASYQANDARVAGVVSTNPAYTMNAGTAGVDVALQGRVPCQVTGAVARGDMMVTSAIPGVAIASSSPAIGTVIGKALGTHSGTGVGIIEVVVGRL